MYLCSVTKEHSEQIGFTSLHEWIIQPPYKQMDTGTFSQKTKQLWGEADHSSPDNANVKNARTYNSVIPQALMPWYVIIQPRDNLTFTQPCSASFFLNKRQTLHSNIYIELQSHFSYNFFN
jgi:GH35 family endo-1,4-beta-xylanase